jgi:NAD(P)-dependent dehydrogenase (short-subunit alcohol dehydrogenase family)
MKILGKAADEHGRVDGVASCVGNMLIKPAHLTSKEEFLEAMSENALSAFNVLKASVSLHVLMECDKHSSTGEDYTKAISPSLQNCRNSGVQVRFVFGPCD